MEPNHDAFQTPVWTDEIHRVSTAFERWQAARRRLQVLTHDFRESQSLDIPLPSQPVTPGQLINWERLVVTNYHQIFQVILLANQARVKKEGRKACFHVWAKWDIADQSPIPPEEVGNIYEVPVLFDMPEEVPGVGPTPCLILGWGKANSFKLRPIPVDHVDQVEFCVTHPPTILTAN